MCLAATPHPLFSPGYRYYVQMVAWYREQHEAAKEAEVATMAVPEMAVPTATSADFNASASIANTSNEAAPMPSPMPSHPATAAATPVSHPVAPTPAR